MKLNLEHIDLLSRRQPAERAEVMDVLQKACTCQGLTLEETAVLLTIADPELEHELFSTAAKVKDALYGNRVVLFAPLYISNLCTNNCRYCGFRVDNRELRRKKLNQQEIAQQTEILLKMGHKRVLLEAGEDLKMAPIEYVLESIQTVYNTRHGRNCIRRINVNIAATTVENYRRLKEAGIGTYQLFQETYHPQTYAYMHPSGPKSDYDYHFTAMERAIAGGIDDFGMGVLYGLYDYRFEVLALVAHAHYLKKTYGIGPHTVSVPRLRPAVGAEFFTEHLVSDSEFKRLVAVLRLALPYTGIILSTREAPSMREFLLDVGVSQISAASATSPGGYSEQPQASKQFELSDERSLDECIASVLSKGYIPSFCTGCYRKERTGERFMDMVEHGHIRGLCHPNAILTLAEYIEDFASQHTRQIAEERWEHWLNQIEDAALREATREKLQAIRSGQRDVYF